MDSATITAWENAFSTWASPPPKTEQERCDNAVKAVKNAIDASIKLKYKNISVFEQGSYRNNTNVRKDSDVDIGILCKDTFYYELPLNATKEQFNIAPPAYSYSDFKNDVQQALISYFGSSVISRGNKAFDIHENTYHVDADVVPYFEHRRYNTYGKYLSGVQLFSDDQKKVINWPEQHYNNGVSKNNDTSRRFKSLVRIVKGLSNYMSDNRVDIAKQTPSFLIECLLWNVPNSNFGHGTYREDVRSCLVFLFNNTLSEDKCLEWGEVSELKYLFRGSQKWTWQSAHQFISAAWNYLGFE